MPSNTVHFIKTVYCLLITAAFLMLFLTYAQPGLAFTNTLQYGQGDHLYGPEIDQWNEDTKAEQRAHGKAFLEKLADAAAGNTKEINLEHDHYRFDADQLPEAKGAFITIDNAENITINGNGAEFWFEDYIGALRIRNSKNITINNLRMDWDPLPFCQSVVTKIDPDGNYVEAKTEAGFRNMNEIIADPYVDGSPTLKVFFFDPQTGVLKRNTAHSEINQIEVIGEDHLRYSGFSYGAQNFSTLNIEPGDRMVCVMRHTHAVRISSSENITFDNFHLYASPMFGIAMGNGGGNLVLQNSSMVPRPGTKRLMSINGDGLHFTSLQKGPTIQNCEFSGAGDDIMNIHGDFAMVQEQHDPRTVAIAIKNYINIAEGSTIRIYDYDTFQRKGEFEVLSTHEANQELRQDARAVGQEKEVKFWPGRTSLICQLDKPVELERYDIVESDLDGGYGTVVRNNRLHNLTTRGMLIQTKNAVIENNEFINVDNAAISIMASLKWCEGPIPQNIVFRNNKIVYPGWTFGSRHATNSKIGAVSVNLEYFGELKENNRPISGITIENNDIQHAGTCGIFMIHSQNSTIRENNISGYCEIDPWRVGQEYNVQPYGAIFLADSEKIDVSGNIIENPGEFAEDDIILGQYVDEASITGLADH